MATPGARLAVRGAASSAFGGAERAHLGGDLPAIRGVVESVNVGTPRRHTVLTAIWKQPAAGRVLLRGVNLLGDDKADRAVHGGPDEARNATTDQTYLALRDEQQRGVSADGELRLRARARKH
jgi:hypothetical protein